MTRTIRIDIASLNQSFEDLLDEMHMQYHHHQSKIPRYTTHDNGQGNITNLPNGSDPDWCNGLPRNGHAVSNGKIK